jgi:hypothetical protein
MCSHMESLNLGMESLKLGSKPPCSNVSDATPCKNSGSLACKDCLMVTVRIIPTGVVNQIPKS